MTICTLFDYNYLDKGLVMIESLLKYNPELEIHALCLDNKTFDFCSKIKEIKTYSLQDLEKEDQNLLKIKNRNIKSELGDWYDLGDHAYYCYSLTPYFTNYILEKYSKESVLYCDSDLIFYENLNILKEEIKEKDCAIVTHKNESAFRRYESRVGIYNVGIIYFKKSNLGILISRFLRDLMFNCSNQFAQSHGTCGDQKYLELFEPLFGRHNIHVVEGNIAHGAPWNFENYTFLNERDVIYKFNNAKQRILFNHFSHFNIKNDKWYSAYKGEWNPETLNQYVHDIYQDYYNKILEIRNKYSIIEEHICPYPNSK